MKDFPMLVPVPSYLSKVERVEDLRVFSSSDFESSLGRSGPLGVDGHARQGVFTSLGISEELLSVVVGMSTLQATVSPSTCEAERTASTYCALNALGVFNPLSVCMPGAQLEMPYLRGDNQAANKIGASQPGLGNRRHLRVPDLWIRNLTRDGRIKIVYIRNSMNASGLLTKVLPLQTLEKLLLLVRISSV